RWGSRRLQEGVVPHGDAVVVRRRQMRDLEVRALVSAEAFGNPCDPLADDRAGRVESLRQWTHGLGGLPGCVGDVAAYAAPPVGLGGGRPVELEPALPAQH